MPRSPRQPYLSAAFKPRTEHGGAIRQGRRKLARPIDPKRPLHVVLRAEKARGPLSLLSTCHAHTIHTLALKIARRHHVRIYQYANSGNHLHLLVKTHTRKGLQDFLRVFCGQAAQLVTHARKGKAFGRFWTLLAYSRLITWGHEFKEVRFCVLRNELEAKGLVTHRQSGRRGRPPRAAASPHFA